jgi:hypothetical protein
LLISGQGIPFLLRDAKYFTLKPSCFIDLKSEPSNHNHGGLPRMSDSLGKSQGELEKATGEPEAQTNPSAWSIAALSRSTAFA